MRIIAEHQIHIEQLKVLARVGVSPAERRKRQRLVLNITLWPSRDLRDLKDAVERTVDYCAVCRSTDKFMAGRTARLIETLASDLAAHLLRTFPIRKVGVEIRKFVLKRAAYVSVAVIETAAVN